MTGKLYYIFDEKTKYLNCQYLLKTMFFMRNYLLVLYHLLQNCISVDHNQLFSEKKNSLSKSIKLNLHTTVLDTI